MKIHHLAIVPALFIMTACGGSSTPEPETPATAGATEAKPAEDAKPADDAKPAEGGDTAAPSGDKPAGDAPADAK